MNSLVEHTNTWFVRPNTRERPKQLEHFWVYASLVSLLGPTVRSSDLRIIHAYFTYLLLGCDPYTGQQIQNPVELDSQLGQDLKYTYERLLDFEHPKDPAPRWDLLVKFYRLPEQFTTKELTNELSVRRTMLMLALTLIAPPEIPTTLLFVKNCLNLYQRSLEFDVRKSMAAEFHASHPMFYVVWLQENINMIFQINRFTTDQCLAHASYLAWFSNLVRTHRTFQAGTDRRSKTFGVIDNLLKTEVDTLRKTVSETALNVRQSLQLLD